MNDLVFGVKLTADGKQLVAEIDRSSASFNRLNDAARAVQADSDKLSQSHGRLASSYNGMTESLKAHNAGMFNASAEVQKLLNKYDPLGTKLRSLEADFNALSKAASQGLTGSRNDAAVDKTYAMLNAEMAKTKDLMREAGVATDSNKMSVKSLGLNTKEAREELMILGREALTGDFSRMPRTFGTLVTSSNLLSAAFTPVGAGILGITTAVVAGVYMWSEWGKAAEAATKKAAKGLEDAQKAADKEQRLTPQEKIQALGYRIQSVGLDVQYEASRAANRSLPNELRSIAAKTAGEKQRELEGLNRQKTDLEDQQARSDLKAEKSAESWLKKQEVEDRHFAKWQADQSAKIQIIEAETAAHTKLTEAQKEIIKLDEEQKNKLTASPRYKESRAALVDVAAAQTSAVNDANILKAEEEHQKWLDKLAAHKRDRDFQLNAEEERTQSKRAPKLDNIYDGIFTPGSNVMETTAQSFGTSVGKSVKNGITEALVQKTGMDVFSKNLGASISKAMSGDFKGMTSSEKGSMYLAVAAVAVSYLGNKETVMTAQQRQSLQGTGTVLGDYNAKSASIANGIDVIAKASMDATPVTMSMAASLKSVDASMKDFLTVAVKSMGGSFSANMGIVPGQMSNPQLKDTGIAAGAAAGAAIGSYFGPWGTAIGGVLGALGGATSKTDRTISDKGLNISGTLGQFRSGGGSISQYVSGVDISSSMFGLYNSTDAWRKQQAVGSDVNVAFANIFSGMATTFKTAAGAMGKDAANFDATMNAMNVNIGDLSLMNMSVTEQQTAIMNVISKTSDTMARTLFPEMVRYNVAGEGMAQTVIRVVAQNEAVITAFNRMGGVQTKITNSSFQMTDELTRAAGGLDKLLTGLQQFTKFYTTGANQLANTYADAKTKFSGTALDAVISSQTTANEIAAYVRAAMNSGISADSKVQILDAANSFSAFLTNMKDGIDKLRQSYDSVISSRDAVVGSIKNLQQFNVTMQDFRRSVVADNSLANPVAKYTDAKRYFDDIAARSAAGDSVAQGKLQSASQALLSMSMTASGSYAQYQRDVSSVLQAVDSTMSYNDKMITNGKDMLSALDTLNGISDVIRQNTWATNTSMMDMSKVLGSYAAATSALGISSSTASPEAKKALVDYVSKADTNFSSIASALNIGGGASAAAGVVGNQVTSAASVAASPANTAAADAAIAVSISNDRKAAKASALDALNAITSTVDKMSLDIIALERAAGGHTTAASYDMRNARIPLLTKQQSLQNAYEALPSFAIGSNYIQHDGPAYIHAGEEITPRPYVDLQRSARDETNSLLARLVANSTELRAELKTLTENQTKDNAVIKASTQTTAELLDVNTGGGGPMLVKVVTA